MATPTAYPLHWPMGYARCKTPEKSRFTASIERALINVSEELRRFGNDTDHAVSNLLLSSNVTLGDTRPQDPGVAAYFRWDNSDCCIAVDRYLTPAENLQAISLVIEAERAKMRHGGLNIVRASFRGYTALPPPSSGKLAAPWWQVLGYETREQVTMASAEEKYKGLVKLYHPDRGGNTGTFVAIADAIREARGYFNSQK